MTNTHSPPAYLELTVSDLELSAYDRERIRKIKEDTKKER